LKEKQPTRSGGGQLGVERHGIIYVSVILVRGRCKRHPVIGTKHQKLERKRLSGNEGGPEGMVWGFLGTAEGKTVKKQ